MHFFLGMTGRVHPKVSHEFVLRIREVSWGASTGILLGTIQPSRDFLEISSGDPLKILQYFLWKFWKNFWIWNISEHISKTISADISEGSSGVTSKKKHCGKFCTNPWRISQKKTLKSLRKNFHRNSCTICKEVFLRISLKLRGWAFVVTEDNNISLQKFKTEFQ